MKKIILISFCCLISGAGFTQIVKGAKAVGGGISYSNTSQPGYLGDGEDSESSFEFIPAFGYFVADGILVGINLGLSTGKTVSFGNETKSSGFAVGPFARYYKQTSNENFAIYGQFSFLYGSGKETDSSDQETKTSAMDIAVSPGLVYFLNNHWAVELGFRGIGYYSSDPDKDVDNDNVKTLDVGLNSFLPASLGFRFHF
jgi:outer membrane protein